MQNELVENLSTAGKASYDALQELGAINSKTFQKLTDIQFSLATLGIESSVEQMKLINSTSTYNDLVNAESELATDYSSKVMEITRQAADVLNESREEVSDWVKSSMSFAVESKKTKKAAKTSTKRSTKKS